MGTAAAQAEIFEAAELPWEHDDAAIRVLGGVHYLTGNPGGFVSHQQPQDYEMYTNRFNALRDFTFNRGIGRLRLSLEPDRTTSSNHFLRDVARRGEVVGSSRPEKVGGGVPSDGLQAVHGQGKMPY